MFKDELIKLYDIQHVDNDKQTISKENNDEVMHESADEDLMLTTIDNPYSPKTEYEAWRRWDIDHHYNTESFIARLIDLPDDVDMDDEPTINRLTNEAIHELLEHDVLNIYVLV